MESAVLVQEVKRCLSELSDDPALSYLAVTSKPELMVRDRVAWALHQRYPDFIVAREYTISSENDPGIRKKVDLAILDQKQQPVVLGEFKAMISPDPYFYPDHGLLHALENDLSIVRQISDAPHLGVMMMVHLSGTEKLRKYGIDERVVKYLKDFRKLESVSDGLEGAIDRTVEFYKKSGAETVYATTRLKGVWDMEVTLVSFVVSPGGQ